MDVQSPYAPPEAMLYAPEPGDDSPLPFEDPEHYPTLKLRIFRTLKAFLKRPVWFFHRVGLGPESLWKPFQLYLLVWSPLFFFTTLVGGIGILIAAKELAPTGGTQVVHASNSLEMLTGMVLLFTFPIWSTGLMLAYGLVIHAGMRMVSWKTPLKLAKTLRATVYVVFLLPVSYLLITVVAHYWSALGFMTEAGKTAGLFIPFLGLLIPGLARIHGTSKARSAVGVLLSLGLIALLHGYTLPEFFDWLWAAIIELKGWAQ